MADEKLIGGRVSSSGERKSAGEANGEKIIVGGRTSLSAILGISPFSPSDHLTDLKSSYLSHLTRAYHALDFKGIPQLESLPRELLLEEVYVPLVARPEMPSGETWGRRLAGRSLEEGDLPPEALALAEKAAAPVPVEEAMQQHKQVVVLGDPGSGKTTLLKHLALRLAQEQEAPLPIILPLNAYAAALERQDLSLQAYLPQHFAAQARGLEGLGPLFDLAIAHGQAVILLDGLDEVQSGRGRLLHKVEAFAADVACSDCRLAVTSRIVGYREAPLSGKEWQLYTLLDFDRQAIEDFANRWCLAIEKRVMGDVPEAQARAEAERRLLLQAIDASPGIAQLACNPLLLTILALIKRQGVTLPNRRVELYELYLKTLITYWSQARALDKTPVGPQLDYLETVAVLGPLALRLRQDNPTAGLVAEERLVGWLCEHFQQQHALPPGEALEKATDFLAGVHKYSNLLVERGQGRYGFLHLTFEEALAARGLVQLGQLELKHSLAYIEKYLADPAWRETILLAVGLWGLVRESPLVAGEVVRAMLKMECPGEGAGRSLLMAGECLADVGRSGLGRAAAAEVQQALLQACRDRSLPPAVQRDLGFLLGRSEWPVEDLEDFVPIPAGLFLFGEEKRKMEIGQPFSIARYPVTNLQFKRFVDDRGYERREYWSEAGWAWRAGKYDSQVKEDWLKDWLARRPLEKRLEPFFWRDPRWSNPLAPVVGVSWFEAEAYCAWKSLVEGRPIRLPTEYEWERAARGSLGWEYPWEGEFDPHRLNCAEFWAGVSDLSDSEKWRKWVESPSFQQASTSIVIQFPEGATPEGVCDLSGNAWEWTASWYDEDRDSRVVRGGSWNLNRDRARCASRLWDAPVNFYNNLGFRVVLSPF